jgi:hypothetical protein
VRVVVIAVTVGRKVVQDGMFFRFSRGVLALKLFLVQIRRVLVHSGFQGKTIEFTQVLQVQVFTQVLQVQV